jgi:hypothetical protein
MVAKQESVYVLGLQSSRHAYLPLEPLGVLAFTLETNRSKASSVRSIDESVPARRLYGCGLFGREALLTLEILLRSVTAHCDVEAEG